jgi:hypothetical protein
MHFRALSPKIMVFLLTFTVSFTVYLFTLSPTVGLEDSGEFITAVASLGIAHPSGYPLYVVLGKLFTLLVPLGDIAWRVNLFSAFCASATVGLLTVFIAEILMFLFPREDTETNARVSPTALLIAGAVSLSFAFSPVFWSQSVIAEVYTLNALLFVATLILLWRYSIHRRASTLYVFAFIYGLSTNNHQMMMLLAPVYFLFLLLADKKQVVGCMKKCLGGLAPVVEPSVHYGADGHGQRVLSSEAGQFSLREPHRITRFARALRGRLSKHLFPQSEGMPLRAGGKAYAADQLATPSTWAFPSDRASLGARTIDRLSDSSESHAASPDVRRGMTASFSAANPSYLIASLVFLLGLSFYLFVLLRAGQDPLLNWDHPETFARLWDHFTRKSYHDVSVSLWGDLWQLKKVIYVHFFFIDLFRQLTLVGSLLALIGFLVAWFRARPLFLLTLGVFLMNSVAIIFLRKLGYQYEGEQIYRVYYLPAYLVAFLWAGIGLHAGGRWLNARAASLRVFALPARIAVGAAALALLPFLAFAENFYASDRSGFWLARDWGVAVLASLAPHAVLIPANEQPSADSQIFTLLYLTLIEGVRPDVAIVDAGNISSRFYHPRGPDIEAISKLPFHQFRTRLLNRVWPLAQKVRRPVYTLYPVGSPLLNGDLIARSNGAAFRVFPNLETARAAKLPPADPVIRNTFEARWMDGAYYRDFVSDIYFARAAYLLEQGHFKPSEGALIDAFNLDQTPLSANTFDYMAYRARWLEGNNSQ